jgi:hypothetical protein
VEFVRVVSISSEMASNHRLDALSIEVGPRETEWVKQHFLYIGGENIPIPNTKMKGLMAPQKDMS